MTAFYKKELYHHGILGQKWGIRRYQNEDGSLTEEGRKRYSDGKLGKKQIEKYDKYLYDLHEKKCINRAKYGLDYQIKELKDGTKDESEDSINKYIELQTEIHKFSGDWYWGKSKSDEFRAVNTIRNYVQGDYFSLDDIFREYRKNASISEDAKKLVDGYLNLSYKSFSGSQYTNDDMNKLFCVAVLKDLGFTVTPETIKLIEPYIVTD